MSNKILIALQFWGGDRIAAMDLAKFIADLEPQHSDLADFLFVARFDTAHSENAILHVSRKFNTYSYVSRKQVTGWPLGCNALWSATTEWVISMIAAKKVPHYKAVFTCEADGCPTMPNWIEKVSQAWDREAKIKNLWIAGPLVGHPAEHINGNLMVSGDLKKLKWASLNAEMKSGGMGWDFALWPEFKKLGAAGLPEIVSLYNTRGYTEEVLDKLVKDGVAWVHGCKDYSLMGVVKCKYLR